MLSFMVGVVRGFLWIFGFDDFWIGGSFCLAVFAFLRHLGLGCTKSYRFPQDDGNGFARLEEGFDFTLRTILSRRFIMIYIYIYIYIDL
jgi:hypothetical protein